ncbi:MAG: citramalate synthase, partial [Candidatus Hydrogenedentes bacterium]|nr:citramalate synthase [Candidatus Hydrogenedentota bacterium]
MCAFGSTRHPKSAVEDDANLKALLAAGTEIVTIFAKSSRVQAKEILRVSLDENVKLTGESVAYLKAQGKRVFLDGEHFFDGFFDDSEYALSVLEESWRNGAEVLILCDTNGGRLPSEIAHATRAVIERLPKAPIGIHAHNDAGCGVANSIAAVEAGAVHIQGTINGYGERTGNANLTTIIPTVQLKMGAKLVSDKQLAKLTHVSHLVAELANMNPRDSDPYVGRDAFTHKGGMHADAVNKLKSSYEHIEPETVGNRTHIAVSEVSGRSSLLQKAADFGITLERDAAETRDVLKRVKDMESEGYEFEGADASLELLMLRAKGHDKKFFTLLGYRVSVETSDGNGDSKSEATVKVELPDGQCVHTAAEGAGPVDAINNALRKALEGKYPELEKVHLEDYKVRILDGQSATSAKTRVFIESTDGDTEWDTVGVSENIIAASVHALLDSIEYKLYRTANKT